MKNLILILLTCSSLSLLSQELAVNNPINSEALSYYVEADRQTQSGNVSAAKELYHKAIKAQNDFVEALDNLATLYKDEFQMDSAMHFFKLSVTAQPNGLLARHNMAAIYQLNGDYTGAIDSYKALLGYYPNYPEAYYGMAVSYLNINQYEEAIKSAESAMRLYMNTDQMRDAADARILAARGFMGNKNYKRALKYIKASKKHFQDKPFYHYYIGLCNLRMGKKDDAVESLKKAEDMGYQLPIWVKEKMKHTQSS